MEIIIFVGFLAFVAFVVNRSAKNNQNAQNRVLDSGRRKRPEHRAFDASTAEPEAEKRIIQGPAYVVDGDTIVVNKIQIRLFGIDAPEIDHPYGKQAKWAMVNLCKGNTISAEVLATDAHGRTVAKCRLADGRDLSAELVKKGLALDWPKFSGGTYRNLETSDARRKLWLADARQKGRMEVWERFAAKHATASKE